MANYYATARSNYFAVKDEAAFRAWAGNLGLTVLEPDHRAKSTDGIRRFGIAPGNNGDSGAWPAHVWDDETTDYTEIDLTAQLAPHLGDGEVAVLMEVGHEALRYVTGSAVAVNASGRTVSIDLGSIYRTAGKLGPNLTRAEY
ncbi:MAG: hypothetical protein J0M04_25455 [Verrucomicrobia bacterium]|nr:hypothetical protein [Verrucomicrobiota bacterium]